MATSSIPKAKTPKTRQTSTPVKKPSSKKSTTSKKNSYTKAPVVVRKSSSLPTPPTRSHYHYKKKPMLTKNMTIFLIIIIILLGRATRAHWMNMFHNGQDNKLVINQEDDVLFVGKDITLEGTIEKLPNNRYSYTHIVDTEKYGKVGIRSSVINLHDLNLTVILQGKVTDFINGLYVVDVEKNIESGDTTDTLSDTIYFSEPGLLIKDLTAQGFATKNSTNVITMINPTTNAHIVLRYFGCDESQAHNCKLFQDSFESTVGVHFTDSYGNKFYKLQDENTWFVNLDNRYGVYIEISNEALLPLFVKNSQFITTTWAKKNLIATAKNICTGQGFTLKDIVDASVTTTKSNVITLTVEGTAQDFEPVQCVLEIDPNNITSGTLISINKKTTTTEPEKTPEETAPVVEPVKPSQPSSSNTSTLSKDNTPQIPLKPGKELTFSTRGLTMLFPSPNISFASRNIAETVNGLQCSTATDIVLYANKDSLSTNPAITIYYCKIGTPTNLSNTRVITISAMTLLVQVKDAAWVDFANAIVVN